MPLQSVPYAALNPAVDRARQADRLKMIRLRLAILFALEDRSITVFTEVGLALGMPGPDAASLLSRKQWREGDLALLEAAAARLGLQVSDPWHP